MKLRSGARLLTLLALLVLVAGCRPPPPPIPAFRFSDPELSSVGARLFAEVEARGAAAGWAFEPLGFGGLGAELSACRGLDGPAGCLGRHEGAGRGWRVLSLDQPPGGGEVAQLSWDAAEFPAVGATGWGARLKVNFGAAGEGGFTLLLFRMSHAGVTDRFELGPEMAMTLAQSEIRLPPTESSELAPLRDLDRAAFLSAWAEARLAGLGAAAVAALDSRRVETCAFGAYLGDGNPRCDRVFLSPAETALLRADVLASTHRRQQAIREDAEELAALFETLWPG